MCYMKILQGDCRELLRTLEDESVDSIVTDPPYELGFMGRKWDASGIAYDLRVWRECLRVLKPGGHLLAFGGTRTYHRMTCAIEDAGFEIRDCIMWVYGSGFPKSHDVSKAIDKAAGAEREVINKVMRSDKRGGNFHGASESRPQIQCNITALATDAARQWQGWGSALKPAVEPIVVARKPLDGTIAENVLRHGTGALNVEGCRVGTNPGYKYRADANGTTFHGQQGERIKQTAKKKGAEFIESTQGRWPANLIHDGSDEVVGLFPQTGAAKASMRGSGGGGDKVQQLNARADSLRGHDDNGGSAARFFYCAKTSSAERGEDNRHPTVKPLALMRYLCRLVTPPKGVVLDPFAGSGSTLVAARAEGFFAIGCELLQEHVAIIQARLDLPIERAEEEEEQREEKPRKSQQLKLL